MQPLSERIERSGWTNLFLPVLRTIFNHSGIYPRFSSLDFLSGASRLRDCLMLMLASSSINYFQKNVKIEQFSTKTLKMSILYTKDNMLIPTVVEGTGKSLP